MNRRLACLLNRLEDEFRGVAGVRVRPVFASTTRRSPDLEQDYDPESASVHRRSGVMVVCARREFFFPEEWGDPAHQAEVGRQIDEVREKLG
jgi:hypothetical protein